MNKSINKVLMVHISQITRNTLKELRNQSIPGIIAIPIKDESDGLCINFDTTVERLDNLKERYPMLKSMPDLFDMISVAKTMECDSILIGSICEKIVACLPVYQYHDFTHAYRGKCYTELGYLNGRLISKVLKDGQGHIIEDILKHNFNCAKDW